jgi:ubiquitin-like-conjugating enzyme ATG3
VHFLRGGVFSFPSLTDKQYLITRNVPCQTRVASMENHLATEDAGDGDDWIVSHLIKDTSLEEEFDILNEDGEVVEQTMESAKQSAVEEDVNEYADMEGFEDDNILDDDAAEENLVQEEGSNLVRVRTYDITITYDKYYQTPRVWLTGKSGDGHPLSGIEMMEDVTSDYANRTVTIENHPHVLGPHASIHPCQHGKVMRTIGEEKGPNVEMYLFIFLKFVNSMIPTINYDFTMDVTADTSK